MIQKCVLQIISGWVQTCQECEHSGKLLWRLVDGLNEGVGEGTQDCLLLFNRFNKLSGDDIVPFFKIGGTVRSRKGGLVESTATNNNELMV